MWADTHLESQAPRTATPAMTTLIEALRTVINNNGAQAGHDATIAQLVLWRQENDPTKKPTSNAVGR
jgi:hypothetical protein